MNLASYKMANKITKPSVHVFVFSAKNGPKDQPMELFSPLCSSLIYFPFHCRWRSGSGGDDSRKMVVFQF